MDPQACIAILCKAAVEHSQQCPGGDACGEACVRGGIRPNRRGKGPRFAAGFDNGAGHGYAPLAPDVEAGESTANLNDEGEAPLDGTQGQVIDLQSGKNETVDGEVMEATLLEMFPELGPRPARSWATNAATEAGSPASAAAEGDGAQTESQQAFDPPPRPMQRPEQASAEAAAAAAATWELPSDPPDLVLSVVKLHSQRVAVHKAYDGAFRHLLTSKGGAARALGRSYPFVVACATARFQIISEHVRRAAAALEAESGPDTKEAVALIRRLQKREQLRLQLVAQMHMELSRAAAAPARGGEAPHASPALRRRLGALDEEIEEAVGELRCCAAELREAAEQED